MTKLCQAAAQWDLA